MLYAAVSCHILLSDSLCASYCEYADTLLKTFVSTLSHLCGQTVLVYNVHNLVHLSQDAVKYGRLDKVSAYRFESFLGKLRKLVRQPNNLASQIVRRIGEYERAHSSSVPRDLTGPNICHRTEHHDGRIPLHLATCRHYKHYIGKGCFMSCTLKDGCFEICGGPVVVRNILLSPEGKTLVVYENFYISQSLFFISVFVISTWNYSYQEIF
jgi:hypothetical protein